MLRSRMPWLVVAGIFVLSGCGEETAESAEVSFTEPQDGAMVSGSDVRVSLQANGVEITPSNVREPGTGHHHIFVNTDVTPMNETIPGDVEGIIHMGDGSSEYLLTGLEPGEHRLITVVADWNHVPIDPPAVDTVFVTVTDSAEDEAN